MADKQVTRTGKDNNGNITSLCGDWGKVDSSTAIQSIALGQRYFVQDPNLGRVEIRAITGAGRTFLRTDPDRTVRNNLDDLPNC